MPKSDNGIKIVLLANAASIHTERWVNSLSSRGYTIHLLSCHKPLNSISENVSVHLCKFNVKPFCYYFSVLWVRKLLKKIKPEIFHVHFASGYGTLGRLTGFHPNILSVWGSDVYDFPNRSPIKKKVLRKNLLAADYLCSTSHVMADEIMKVSPACNRISVTPFGVDVNMFTSNQKYRDSNYITIGTVKTMSHKYGIDILMHAFHQLRNNLKITAPEMACKLRLLIVGGGNDIESLRALSCRLNIEDVTTFEGQVSHSDIPEYLNKLDIYVATSRQESFGVAVLEASACELPVVVSDVGGLPEVVIDGETGYVVDSENIAQTAEKLSQLIIDPDLRRRMGVAGREHVIEQYEWNKNVSIMENIYADILNERDRQLLAQ